MRGSSGAFKGSAQLTVLGTFSPLADSTNYFHNTLLADGSTMNLSDCTGHAFNCIAANGNRVTFPDGGTVTQLLHNAVFPEIALGTAFALDMRV